MSEAVIVNEARVMAKGQVTIPKNIRSILGINTGDRVTFPLEFRAGAIPSPAPSIRRIYPPWRFPFSSVSEIKVN